MLIAGRIARGGVLADGWLEVSGGGIADAGVGSPPRIPDVRHNGIVAPGLCDLQVNGAGGHDVTGGHAALDEIDAILLEHGVTSYLPTVISLDDDAAARAVAEIAERTADPSSPVAGIHLEGPFLNPDHAGMHAPDRLRAPADGIPSYYESSAVRLVTLAPELPGALALIESLRARGVTASLGHSAASAEVSRQAVDAGAKLVTHLFNAMAPLHQRAPGLAGLALVDARLRVSVVADGIHVDPLVLELVRRAAASRVVLVSDATPAAAAEKGRYTMAGAEIEQDPDGAVRTRGGVLAGSALTLDGAVRSWASLTEASLAEALAAASESPATAVGLPAGLGPGRPADVVLVGANGAVERVMRRGVWID